MHLLRSRTFAVCRPKKVHGASQRWVYRAVAFLECWQAASLWHGPRACRRRRYDSRVVACCWPVVWSRHWPATKATCSVPPLARTAVEEKKKKKKKETKKKKKEEEEEEEKNKYNNKMRILWLSKWRIISFFCSKGNFYRRTGFSCLSGYKTWLQGI